MERVGGNRANIAGLLERRRTEPATAPSIGIEYVETAETPPTPQRPRLDAVDFLRGLVMVVMVLDHTRDFVGAAGFNPRDGLSLPTIYMIWLGVVIGLYPLCRWFAALKQSRNAWWLSSIPG